MVACVGDVFYSLSVLTMLCPGATPAGAAIGPGVCVCVLRVGACSACAPAVCVSAVSVCVRVCVANVFLQQKCACRACVVCFVLHSHVVAAAPSKSPIRVVVYVNARARVCEPALCAPVRVCVGALSPMRRRSGICVTPMVLFCVPEFCAVVH